MNRKRNAIKWKIIRFLGSIMCFFIGHKNEPAFGCGRPVVVVFCPRCIKVHSIKPFSR